MWLTVGHDKALSVLQRGLESDRLSHSYLIAGPAQVGKTTLALDLARAVNCVAESVPCGECDQCRRITANLHPDVRIIGLEPARSGRLRTQISIEQMRDLQRDTSLLPFEGQFRVLIIESAELLSEEAANSLLKTLEEPPERVMLILLASDAGALLPTIVSRCRLIQLRPVAASKIADFLTSRKGVSPDKAQEIAGAASGRFGWAVRAADDPDLLDQVSDLLDGIETVAGSPLTDRFDYAASLAGRFPNDRKSVYAELELWLSWWRDVLLTGQHRHELVSNVSRLESLTAAAAAVPTPVVAAAIRTIMRTSFLLERNVTPRLALEAMMLSLPALNTGSSSAAAAG